MRKSIAIVGAGQSGLLLAFTLMRYNYSVNLFNNRSGEQINSGRILSSQGMFDSALKIERELGLDFWEEQAPKNEVVTFSLVNSLNGENILKWQGKTIKPYLSVDQRIKFPVWMKKFEEENGKLTIEDINLTKLDEIVKVHDLTIIAGGKGEICQSFPRNETLSIFKKPQRVLSCLYVNEVVPGNPSGVRANIIPDVGEFFIMPGLTHNGLCEMMLFEGIPNGPFDCWQNIKNVNEQFEMALKLLQRFLPEEAKRCRNAKPTDNNAGLMGSYTPVIKHPTFQLPCGKYVLGIGDAIVLNDPIAGQGANNACKATEIYVEQIMKHKSKKFDKSWMEETFKLYWEKQGKYATQFSNLLLSPPESHFLELLKAASTSTTLANLFANAFDEPSLLFPWILNTEATQRMIIKNQSPYEQKVNQLMMSSS